GVRAPQVSDDGWRALRRSQRRSLSRQGERDEAAVPAPRGRWRELDAQPRKPATGPHDALWPGGRTTTVAPIFTRSKRSMTSSLVMRMQPDEMAWPIYSGWLVPWMRNRVSLLPS